MYLVIIFAVLLLVLTAISGYFVKVLIYPKTKEYNYTYEHEIEKGIFTKEYYEGLEKEELKIKSSYGYDINAVYFPNGNSKKTVIIAHGYTYTLYGSIKYARIFSELGFNTLVYDHRYHGLSGGKYSSFGYREKDDLKSVFDYVKDRFGEDTVIGTHGESLGGATVLLHGAIESRVDFIVADCSFSDMKSELAHRLKLDYRLPAFPILNVSSLINRIALGYYYKDVSPIKEVENITAPTMIIHGQDDDYTPYQQGKDLYEKLKCSKYFYGAEGADHATSLVTDEARYAQEVKTFLIENKLI